MKRLAILCVIVMALMVVGCSKTEESGGQVSPYEDIIQLINDDPEGWFSVYSVMGEEEGDTIDTLDIGLKTPRIFYRWFRRGITDNIKVFVDTSLIDTAFVTVTGSLEGKFVTAAILPPDTLLYVHEKPFADTLLRYFVFVRDTSEEYYGGWRLHAASGVALHSIPQNTIFIDSVRILVDDGTILDTTIRNPLELAERHEVMRIPRGRRVDTYMWVSGIELPPSAVAAYLHVWLGGRFRRLRMRYNPANGCFARGFYMFDRLGVSHMFFDILTKTTVMDTTKPYDSMTWGIPYIVTP